MVARESEKERERERKRERERERERDGRSKESVLSACLLGDDYDGDNDDTSVFEKQKFEPNRYLSKFIHVIPTNR